MLVNLASPVELIDYQLFKSNSSGKMYCLPTFQNVSDKKIMGLKVAIYCRDQFGELLTERDSTFLYNTSFQVGISPKQKTAVNEKIELPNLPAILSVEMDVLQVLFEDKSQWEKGDTHSIQVNISEIDNPKLLEFIRNREGNDATYYAEQFTDTWGCVCGRINENKQLKCKRCNRKKEDVFTNYSDKEKLVEELNAFEKEQAERLQLQRVAQLKQDVLKKKRTKKMTKTASIAVFSILLLGLALFGVNTKFTFSMDNYHLLKNKDKDAVLLEMVQKQNIASVEFLLDNGANAEHFNEEGKNSIVEAIKLGNKPLVMTMLDKESMDMQVDGETLAHIALKNGKLGILKEFLALGFDMNTKNDKGDSLLYSALQFGSDEITDYLIHDAHVQLQEVDSIGNNLIQTAILLKPNDVERVTSYLSLNIDLKSENLDGLNTYETALKTKNIQLVNALIDSGEMDVNNVDDASNSALHFYLTNHLSNISFFSKLIEYGADVNGFNKEGYSPLYLAIHNERVDVVETLFAHKVDLEKVTVDGKKASELAKEKPELLNVFSPKVKSKQTSKIEASVSFLGMSEEELIGKMGPPLNQTSYQGAEVLQYSEQEMYVDFYSREVIMACSAKDAYESFGVRVGSTLMDVKAVLGKPDYNGDYDGSFFIGYNHNKNLLEIFHSNQGTVLNICEKISE